MEEMFIVCGLITGQVILSAYNIVINHFTTLGVDSLFVVIFGSVITALLLLPFAIIVERKKWPRRLKPIFMIQTVLLSFTGTTYQSLLLLGMKKTSATIASVVPNLVPGIIFIIAVLAGFERFSLWCKYSRIKVLGTIVCLTGAVVMSIWTTSRTVPDPAPSRGYLDMIISTKETINFEWILGCCLILFSVFLMACTSVLLAAALVHFPAPLSLSSIMFFLGSFITAMLQFIAEGKVDAGTSNFSSTSITALALLSGVVNAVCIAYQIWCIGKKGPVLVSIISPIQTVSSVLLSAMFMGQIISLASISGMITMFLGLYVFLWAKGKESQDDTDDKERQVINGHENPLLT